jgi:hypothetical protein
MSVISSGKEYVELIHPSVIKARRQTYLKRGVLGEKLSLVIPLTLEGFEAEINGLIQGDFSEQFKKRLMLQKWHENGEIVTYSDIEEAKTGVIEELRKPIEGPRYARVGIHFVEVNNDTLVLRWNPSLGKWNRMCLPNSNPKNVFTMWSQTRSRPYGSPWIGYVYWYELNGVVGSILINFGSGFYLHPTSPSYYNINATRMGLDPGTRGTINWQHDKVNHKFSYEFYIDNDNEEHNPNVLYDDDESFWTVYQSGSGSCNITIGEETTIIRKGTSSLKIILGSGSYGLVGISHQFFPSVDWSSYDFLCLYWYGANSGISWNVSLLAPDWSNRFEYSFLDNWSGWRRIVIPLRAMSKIGSPSLTNIAWIIIWCTANSGTTYLDRTLIDVGKWVKCEVYVPDYLNQNVNNVKLYFWDKNSNTWGTALEAETEVGSFSWENSRIFYLSGHSGADIWGSGSDKFNIFLKGKRGESKTGYSGAEETTITYSNYYGCKSRIGFGLKMPPDDGQDSTTTGISQAKCKIEIYYDKGETGQWGEATFEFEDSTNVYYGLRRIEKKYILLFHGYEKRANFIILPNTVVGDGLPNRLEITADENTDITRVLIGWASKKTSDLRYGLDLTDPSLDSDNDGIPDLIENVESYVGGLS